MLTDVKMFAASFMNFANLFRYKWQVPLTYVQGSPAGPSWDNPPIVWMNGGDGKEL